MSESRSTCADAIGAIVAGLIVVAFSLLLLWHDPLVFWNDDYELSILPVFTDVARSWSEGHWPLLSPYSWVCSDLAVEFQYGTFSIFVNAAVVLIWKFPLTFPQQAATLSITHLFVLAAGAFVLGRDRKLSVPLSMLVALVAALNGWIICWGATDWFGALGAFAWLPWAWWGLERALDPQRSLCRFLWPAPFVYLVVTGGFPYTVVMLALLIVWLSIRALVRTRRFASIWPMLFGSALGIGLAAPAWLAIFDYVRGSGRQLQASTTHWQWIVPPVALPGLILPCWTVKWTDFSTRYLPHSGTELAAGLVPPAALIAGFISRHRALVRQIGWELVLLGVVLAISMLPSAGMFRWSFRWLPFLHLILALCAAEAVRLWPRATATVTTRLFASISTPGQITFALVALTAAAMSVFRVGGRYAFPLSWIFLGLAAVWAIADFWQFAGRDALRQLPDSGQRSALSLPYNWMLVGLTFAAFLATYLCIPPNCGVPKYNLTQELTKPAPLDPDRLYLSVYPPAETTYRSETKPGPVGQVVRPGSTAMFDRLHFINGYSPILTAGVARQFKFAIHGEIDWEAGRHLLTEEAGADGELARLGVDGIVVATEVGIDPATRSEWELAFANSEGYVFHRRSPPFARVRSVTSIDSRPNEQFAVATISQIENSRNSVEADVDAANGDRPALLTFSRPYFQGYQAKLGHRKLPVDSYRGLFPVVELPPGSHGRLLLSYRPLWLTYGGGVSILCAALFVGGVATAVFVGRRSSRPTPNGGQNGRPTM